MTSPSDDPAQRVLKHYASAVLAKDIDAFVSLYDRKVCVFDAWEARSCEGADAWRAMTEAWFASLGTDRVVVEFEDVCTRASAALAYACVIVRYTAVCTANRPLRSLQNRMTIVLEPREGGWKVVHQHTSSPIDFQTKRAILEVQ
jgi:uncharacterized protein (TIGR02246 family)